MVNLSFFKDKKFGILGLGRSGCATALALQKNGAQVIAWDDTQEGRQQATLMGISIVPLDPFSLKDLDILVVSPGVPLTHPEPHPIIAHAKALQIPITGDLDLFYTAHKNARFIGVTGTNGKSTTTSLIGHILKTNNLPVTVGGNIGIPVLELEPISENGYGVLEVSSFQLDLNPLINFDIAILMNITPDHLDRHGNFENYIMTKKKIFQHQGKDQVAIIGIDSPSCYAIARELQEKNNQKVILLGIERLVPGGFYTQDGILYNGTQKNIKPIFDLKTHSRLRGTHNWQNMAISYIACHELGLPDDKIINSIENFPGLVHRQEFVSKIASIEFINDSKATNGEATAKALACFNNIYWILGGLPKQDGLTATKPYFPKIAHAFLIGKAASEFAKEFNNSVPFSHAETLEKATQMAFEKALKDQLNSSTILLSPACASYDQFKNFEERGNCFKAIVKKMIDAKKASNE